MCAAGPRIPRPRWTPYVVLAYGRRHNSAGEWAAQGPLPRLGSAIQHEVRRNLQLPVLQVEQQPEQRREGLAEQLLKRVQEQEKVQVEVKVEIRVAIQVQTRVLVQARTRLRIPLQALPRELLRIPRGARELLHLGIGFGGRDCRVSNGRRDPSSAVRDAPLRLRVVAPPQKRSGHALCSDSIFASPRATATYDEPKRVDSAVPGVKM